MLGMVDWMGFINWLGDISSEKMPSGAPLGKLSGFWMKLLGRLKQKGVFGRDGGGGRIINCWG